MSAIPVNDDHRPVSLPCWQAMRAVNGLPEEELRMVMAASIGALNNRTGTAQTARAVGRVIDALKPPVPRAVSLSEIALSISIKHGVKMAEILAPDTDTGARTRRLTNARQEAFWVARQQKWPGGAQVYSFNRIGAFFGGRDHTTVMHGVNEHGKRQDEGAGA